MKTILAIVAVLMLSNCCYAQCGGAAQSSCSGVAATSSCGGVLVLRRTPVRSTIAAFAERAAVRATIRRDARASRLSSCGGAAAVSSSCGGQAVRLFAVRPVVAVARVPVVPLNCPDGVCPVDGGALFVPRVNKHL